MTTTNKNTFQIIVLRSKLLEALNTAERAVGSDVSSLPVLKHVLVRAHGGQVVLTTTNLQLVAEHSVAAKVTREGSCSVPFHLFSAIVKGLASERVQLEARDGKLALAADNYEGALYSQSGDEFPIVPELKDVLWTAAFSSSVLKEALTQASSAIQYSDIRPEISGAYLRLKDGKMACVGTDSFRLAERTIGTDGFTTRAKEFACIVPLEAVQAVLRVFPDGEEEITVSADVHQVLFQGSTRRILSRLIEGAFPDYEQVMPRARAREVRISRQELLGGVKIVSALSGRGCDVAFKIGDNKKFVELFSSESSLGENTYKIPAKIEGGAFMVAFNWRYLMDGLKIFKGEEVIISMNGEDRPALIESGGDPHLKYVVMPIKS